MNPTVVVLRAGLARGGIELKQTLTAPGDVITFLAMTGGFLAAILPARHTPVPGTDFSLGTSRLVSVLALDIALYGIMQMGDRLVGDREDGTLLRAKAIPNGVLGYLIGKVVNISAQILLAVTVTLAVGAFLVSGLTIGDPGKWPTLAWVLGLGLLATLPLGAALGSLFPDTRTTVLLLLALGALAAISGIFYPITHLPAFLQWTAQAFPLYWLGLGMRSALLPHAMAAAEIGHSWRHPATVGVLTAWAVAGLALAPVVMRRTTRRESGSKVAARREAALRGR